MSSYAHGVLLVCLLAPAALAASEPEHALVDAVRRGQTVKVQALLDQGTAPTLRAVLTACGGSRPDILRLLIDAGAEVNGRVVEIPGVAEETPLTLAARRGRRDMVEMLLGAGANPQATNLMGPLERTPLEEAASAGHADVVELLSRAAGGAASSTTLGTGHLADAVRKADFDLVRVLVEAGADVRSPDARTGDTPLSLAAGVGSRDIAAFLIEAGADVNSRNADGSTPLMHAARRGSVELIDFFLEKGGDIDARDQNDRHAISYGDGFDPVSRLIERSSPEIRSFRSAPAITGPGTYPPGVYNCPCGKSGAPPARGVPPSDGGSQTSVSTRVRGARGFKASAAPPECAPVDFSAPGEYSLYVVSCDSDWVVRRHVLRGTEHAEYQRVETTYTHAVNNECSEATSEVRIEPGAEPPGRCKPSEALPCCYFDYYAKYHRILGRAWSWSSGGALGSEDTKPDRSSWMLACGGEFGSACCLALYDALQDTTLADAVSAGHEASQEADRMEKQRQECCNPACPDEARPPELPGSCGWPP